MEELNGEQSDRWRKVARSSWILSGMDKGFREEMPDETLNLKFGLLVRVASCRVLREIGERRQWTVTSHNAYRMFVNWVFVT